MPYCSQDTISLFDRGGNRQILFDAHLQADRQFIVRQKGDRHLIYEGKAHAFGYLTVKTLRHWAFSVERIHHNKVRKRIYDCGAIGVKLPMNDKKLWLVTMKEPHGGYCWLLCYF